jgi:DNA transformation protein
MSALKLRNIGPKSAAWLRQVGLRSAEDLAAVGAVGAFVKVRRAGFKPSLNLLYSLEGALVGCHWQEVPEARRQQLVAEYEAAAGGLTTLRAGQQAGPVLETRMQPEAGDDDSADEVAEIHFGGN